MKYCGVNVFDGIPAGPEEASYFDQFLDQHDFAAGTRRGFALDLRKLAKWFTTANKEPFVASRVTLRDVTDFRDHLRRERRQAVATVNRNVVLLRRYFGWLVEQGHIATNPAKGVKQLRQQSDSPKGLDRSQVRKLLRELELRQDIRATAIFSAMLYTGCRVGDLVNLELHDIILSDRSGSVTYRHGKGSKQRSVPLPLPARRAMEAYMKSRPPVESSRVFVGERGPLSERGFRALCDKYTALIGVKLHPHVFRHTFAKQFLADNENDLVSLASLLGHENINTTAKYSRRSEQELADATDRVTY